MSGRFVVVPEETVVATEVVDRAICWQLWAAGRNEINAVLDVLRSVAASPTFRARVIEHLRAYKGKPECRNFLQELVVHAYQPKNTSGLPGVARRLMVDVFMLHEGEADEAGDS